MIGIYEVIENDEMVFRPSDAGIEQLPDIDTPTRTSPLRDQLTADDDERVGLALDDETPSKRKRKKYDVSVKDRKSIKYESLKQKHNVKAPCTQCQKTCIENIDDIQRTRLNNQFWDLNWEDRRRFILNACSRHEIKRRTTQGPSQKNNTYKYFLKDHNDCSYEVCNPFF